LPKWNALSDYYVTEYEKKARYHVDEYTAVNGKTEMNAPERNKEWFELAKAAGFDLSKIYDSTDKILPNISCGKETENFGKKWGKQGIITLDDIMKLTKEKIAKSNATLIQSL
jgi:hypothetical protein